MDMNLEMTEQIANMLTNTIDRNKSYPDDIRFLMLFDKFQIALDIFKISMVEMFHTKINNIKNENQNNQNNQNNKINVREEKIRKINEEKRKILNVYDVIKNEFNAFDKYLRKPQTKMEDMLNQILLGPDFPEGKRMMNDAKKDFNMKRSEQEIIDSGNIIEEDT